MVPRFLNTGFKYVEVINFTDVQQVIDAAVALVTSPADPSCGWNPFTLDGAGFYVRPNVPALQIPEFKFKLTRSTQYRMTGTCRGGNNVNLDGTSPNNSIQIPANNCLARIFAGDGLFCIDITTYTTKGELFWCGVLDCTPDDPNFIGLNTAWCMGSRRNSDFARQYSDWPHVHMQWGDDTPTSNAELGFMLRISGGGNGPTKNMSGSLIYKPREIWAKARGDTGVYGEYHWVGRNFQTIIVPSPGIVPGSTFYVPIDTGVLAQFCALVGDDGSYGRVAAIRIG